MVATDVVVAPWQHLVGKIAPEVLAAPKTGGDPHNKGDWPEVHERVVAYLEANVVGRPWADHLALAAAVLIAWRRDVNTVQNVLWVLHPRFTGLFAALGLETMDGWDAEKHLPAYLKGELLPEDTQSTRSEFWKCYKSAALQSSRWLESLPDSEREIYRQFVLPVANPGLVYGLVKGHEVRRQQQQTRKAETDAVVPQFSALRAEAHFRYNRLIRLRQAYHDAFRKLQTARQSALPLAFSYEEGEDPEKGVPAQEQLHFRIWDRRSFVLAHANSYCKVTIAHAQRRRGTFAEGRNGLFLEFVRAEQLAGDAPPEGLWFTELLQRGMLGNSPRLGQAAEIAAKQEWLRAWGYGEEDSDERVRPFSARISGLLAWPREGGDSAFISEAQAKAEGVLIPVEPLYAAATFGLLAVDLFTTTGMRMNEAMQIRLTPDCFVRLAMPAPPGAQDPSPRVRWAFRLIPKGERTNHAHTYFMGQETKRLLVKVARMLAEHYSLKADESLPVVRFDPHNGRAHRFGPAPYLFQFSRRHLPDEAITACMRFLLHGMVFQTREGQPVVLKAHLLRHAFATHAVQVEKIPLDIVGEWLKQKNLDVTDYYSKPTESMVAEAADLYLARVAARVNVGEAVRRSPEELRKLYEEARGKAGTLAEVIGGYCVSHGYCAAKFTCVGCAGKVPDPAKRGQVERHKQWALAQVDFAVREGLYPEAERMKRLVRDCEAELQEMGQIEAYRRDEARAAQTRFEQW